MMGPTQVSQAVLFNEVSPEDYFPQDNLLELIGRFVDLRNIRMEARRDALLATEM